MSKRGTAELGDIYDYDESSINKRGIYLGRLVIDFGRNEFWQKPPGMKAVRLSYDDIAFMVANNLIAFDQKGQKSALTQYLMKLEARKEAVEEARIKKIQDDLKIQDLTGSKKLKKAVTRRSRGALTTLCLASMITIGIAGISQLPPEALPAPMPTIELTGFSEEIPSQLLEQATAITTFGSGADVYGTIFHSSIQEVGQGRTQSIMENVLVNPSVSPEPIHMRPLYYKLDTFHQTEFIPNSDGSDSGVYLDNPNGFTNGVPANELVLVAGRGMKKMVIAAPDIRATELTPQEAQQALEAEAAAIQNGADATDQKKRMEGTKLPLQFLGFEDTSLAGDVNVSSYWYKPSVGNIKGQSKAGAATLDGVQTSNPTQGIKRKIALYNLNPVLEGQVIQPGLQASTGAGQIKSILDPTLLNYQDEDADTYDPAVGKASPKGSVYYVAYREKLFDYPEQVKVRIYAGPKDFLEETLTNTLSSFDITNNQDPILHYKLVGKYMIYEQSGYVWVSDLSRVMVTVEDSIRKVTRTNPIKIARISDIKPFITKDMTIKAKQAGEPLIPEAKYEFIQLPTINGIIQGLVFTHATTGDLVFQQIPDKDLTEEELLEIPRIIVANVKDRNASVVGFTVRGSNVIWIEQSQDGKRFVKTSPVYYKSKNIKVQDKTPGTLFSRETVVPGNNNIANQSIDNTSSAEMSGTINNNIAHESINNDQSEQQQSIINHNVDSQKDHQTSSQVGNNDSQMGSQSESNTSINSNTNNNTNNNNSMLENHSDTGMIRGREDFKTVN